MRTDTAANTVKLNLADVLSLATDASIANGVGFCFVEGLVQNVRIEHGLE